jgi:hypothetical protein
MQRQLAVAGHSESAACIKNKVWPNACQCYKVFSREQIHHARSIVLLVVLRGEVLAHKSQVIYILGSTNAKLCSQPSGDECINGKQRQPPTCARSSICELPEPDLKTRGQLGLPATPLPPLAPCIQDHENSTSPSGGSAPLIYCRSNAEPSGSAKKTCELTP